MKIEGSRSASGSGAISQRHGSADPDPDPHQNVMDPQHRTTVSTLPSSTSCTSVPDSVVDPDSTYHPNMDPDADPDSDFYLMRIRILLDADPDADPGYQNDADPDPQHCCRICSHTW
jgi:hypothetical protein